MLLLRTCALAALVCFAAGKNTFSPYWGEYNTTGAPVEGKINVHLVPHTVRRQRSLRAHTQTKFLLHLTLTPPPASPSSTTTPAGS